MLAGDDAFGLSIVRADGRVLHPSYLWEVKSASESKGAWDYLKLLATTPAGEAFRPMLATCDLSKCSRRGPGGARDRR